MRKITIREAKRTFKVAIIGSKGVGKSGEYFYAYFSPWLTASSFKTPCSLCVAFRYVGFFKYMCKWDTYINKFGTLHQHIHTFEVNL